MKHKVLTVLAAAALVTISGCSAGQNTADDEAESIVIDDVQIIEETELVSEFGTEEEEFIVEDESEEPVPEYASEKESEELTEEETKEETEEETEENASLTAKISRKTPSSEQSDAMEQVADAAADLASTMESEPSAKLMVTADRVNARSGPSTDDASYGVLVPGTPVAVLDPGAEWSEIRYMNDNGEAATAYVKTEYLADTMNLYEASQSTAVYAEPSADAESLGSLEAGEEIVVSSASADGFSTVRYTVDGKVEDAYVRSADLVFKDLSDDEDAQALLAAAGNAESAEPEAEEPNETAAEEETEEESETEEETELVAEAAFEEESESEFVPAVAFEIGEGAQSQFAVLQAVLPSAQSVGIIYSEDNENAGKKLEEYNSLAESAGMSVNAVSIESASDIDLAAAELVGEVDAVFCLDDDETVNELIRTIDAYADEVGIPVIGLNKSQVEDGALAAYADGVLYWNTEEASSLDVNADSLDAETVEEI